MKTETAAELMAREVPPESAQAAYRRGYWDGYLEAVINVEDKRPRTSLRRFVDNAMQFVNGPLASWQREGLQCDATDTCPPYLDAEGI